MILFAGEDVCKGPLKGFVPKGLAPVRFIPQGIAQLLDVSGRVTRERGRSVRRLRHSRI